MIDFTREELKEIICALNDIRDHIEDSLSENPLINKIQALIDDYHEHTWDCACGSHCEIYCVVCGKIYQKT